MKTLYLNNFNYLRGGAENVFLSEAALMEKHGNEVYIFTRQHQKNLRSQYETLSFPGQMKTQSLKPSADGLRSLCQLFYNRQAKHGLAQILDEVCIDVAHAHNIYGGLTTSVLDLLYQRKIPTLLTLHDYKLICPNYKLLSHGQVCEDCKSGKFYMAVWNACHRDSRIASAIYALETYFNELSEKYRNKVQLLIAPSRFLRDKFIEFNWPENHIEYIPNFLNLSDFEPQYSPGNYFLYLGRLSVEKGIVNAYRCIYKPLKIPILNS